MSVPTRTEIDDVLNRLAEKIDAGGTRYFNMTYEQGVEEGIRWALGETDDNPYEEE